MRQAVQQRLTAEPDLTRTIAAVAADFERITMLVLEPVSTTMPMLKPELEPGPTLGFELDYWFERKHLLWGTCHTESTPSCWPKRGCS